MRTDPRLHLSPFPTSQRAFEELPLNINVFRGSSQGAWNPTLSTSPTVLNNRRLFTSSTSDRCNNWLRTSTIDRFLVKQRLSTALWPFRPRTCGHCSELHWWQHLDLAECTTLFSSGQNLDDLWPFVKESDSCLLGLKSCSQSLQ